MKIPSFALGAVHSFTIIALSYGGCPHMQEKQQQQRALPESHPPVLGDVRNLQQETDLTTSAGINLAFRNGPYAHSKTLSVAMAPYILIARRDSIKLFSHGQFVREWDSTEPELFSVLKTIGHSSLGMFGVCYSGSNITNGGNVTEGGDGCDAYSSNSTQDLPSVSPQYMIDALEALQYVTVDQELMHVAPVEEQEALTKGATRLVEKYSDTMYNILNDDCSVASFRMCLDFMQDALPILQPIVSRAANARLQQYTAAFEQVRDDIGETAWNQVVVLNAGAGVLRAGSIDYAAILKVMGPDVSGVRLFYSESFPSDEQALVELERRVSDPHLSQMFFGNDVSMSIELMVNNTIDYIGKLFIAGYPNERDPYMQNVYYRNNSFDVVREVSDAGGSDGGEHCDCSDTSGGVTSFGMKGIITISAMIAAWTVASFGV